MTEGRYVTVRLMFRCNEDDKDPIERALNQMAGKGYRFVAVSETMDSQDSLYSLLIFERETPARKPLFSEETALDWTTVQPDHGDSILLREAAAAQDDARPVVDPLLAGLTR